MDDRKAAHARGFALTLFGVLVLTPDTLLIRLIDSDPWTMVFWRGTLMPASLMLVFLWHRKGRVIDELRGLGRRGLAVALLYAVNSLCFVTALELTSVSNTLVILASSGLFAALLSLVFLRERVAGPTWAAILTGMAGVTVVVGGSLGQGTLLGDFIALITALSMAATFVVIRGRPTLNMIPATALGGLVAALVALPLARPQGLAADEMALMLLLGLVILPVAFGLLTLGPRSVPAPEVALLLLLETVLGPLWVWMGVGEEPPASTFLGGVIIIAAVALHAVWRLRSRRPAGGLAPNGSSG